MLVHEEAVSEDLVEHLKGEDVEVDPLAELHAYQCTHTRVRTACEDLRGWRPEGGSQRVEAWRRVRQCVVTALTAAAKNKLCRVGIRGGVGG